MYKISLQQTLAVMPLVTNAATTLSVHGGTRKQRDDDGNT
jgi:hypothetical protein